MKWVKFDRYGNEQTWYSDGEVEKLEQEIKDLKNELQEKYLSEPANFKLMGKEIRYWLNLESIAERNNIDKIHYRNAILELTLKNIKTILITNKMLSLPLVGINAILDIIKKVENNDR